MKLSEVNKALQYVREGRPRYRVVLRNDFHDAPAAEGNDEPDV
jgi:hypothetical protein